MTATELLDLEDARVLADDLLRLLAGHIGDEGAVNTHMQRWSDTLGPTTFAFVCMVAVQRIFHDCLTVVRSPAPPGATSFATPPEEMP